jgi:hypothetical protein
MQQGVIRNSVNTDMHIRIYTYFDEFLIPLILELAINEDLLI